MTSGDIAPPATTDPTDLPPTLPDVRERALAMLDPAVRDFLEGGAGDETTLHRNRRAFDRWQLLPRAMSGLGSPSTRTEFLGIPLELPVLTAPFGADELFHPEGQRAVARANAAAGVAGIAPEAGSSSIEQIATVAAGAPMLAQLHPMGPPENFRAMLRRIVAAGYRGICVTVDCPTGGWRERLRRRPVDLVPVITGNYTRPDAVEPDEVFGQLFDRTGTRVWGWDELGAIMRDQPLPWMAKGVLTGDDAAAAVRAGASAVLVSNHGGRQLDGAPSALEQLPEVAAAVDGRAQIALDSGVRRGADLVKALALGADVVVLGRLAVYGLVVGGSAGVGHVHRLLREECATILTLLGRGDATDLTRDAVREVTW
jgi:isopentenyl diphosphate isomerase/L-lactate dehydrogenase-like FMN-dependent dehydrogenase